MVVRAKSEVRRTKDKTQASGTLALAACVAILALMPACREWDNPLDPTGNRPPTVPSYPRPVDSGVERDSGLVLSWHSYDPDDGDTAYFDILLGTASPPSLVQSAWTDTTFRPTNVTCSTEYYWRVIAYDNHGDSAVGPLWQFQTAALISVTAPDTAERLRMYTQDTITWTGGPTVMRRAPDPTQVTPAANGGRGLSSGATSRVPVSPDALDSTVVYRSTDDGASWIRLGQATTPGQFVWEVPAPATESARVRVRVYAATDTMTGTSGRFAIEDTLPPSGTNMTSSDSSPVGTIGSIHNITWFGGTRGAVPYDDGTVSVLGTDTKERPWPGPTSRGLQSDRQASPWD